MCRFSFIEKVPAGTFRILAFPLNLEIFSKALYGNIRNKRDNFAVGKIFEIVLCAQLKQLCIADTNKKTSPRFCAAS